MAANIGFPPRFFKVFISHHSSESMLIPISYYDELPQRLPKTAILKGNGGCNWKVSVKERRDGVYFEEGWPQFVQDNSLTDGDFMTFVYNRDRRFEVSIYNGRDGCKELRAVAEVEDDDDDDDDDDDEEDSVDSLSIEDSDSSSESEMINTPIPITKKNKGKEIVVESSDDEDDSNSDDSDTSSESEMANTTIPTSKNKGKGKEKVVYSSDEDDDTDSDYVEAFSRLDVSEDNSNSNDSSYSLDSEDEEEAVSEKPKVVKKPAEEKVPGKSSAEPEREKLRKKIKPKIKNPEMYLDDPNNLHFETGVKNRKYELLVHAQLVKDYSLKFKDMIEYRCRSQKLKAKTAKWKDERVCIKKWNLVTKANKVQNEDRILCELLRKKNLVYAVKVHIIKAKDLQA